MRITPIMFNGRLHRGKRRAHPVPGLWPGKHPLIPARCGRIAAESLRRFAGHCFPCGEPIPVRAIERLNAPFLARLARSDAGEG